MAELAVFLQGSCNIEFSLTRGPSSARWGRQAGENKNKKTVCVGGGGLCPGPIRSCLIASLARAASRRGLCGSGVRVGPGTDVWTFS